MGGSARPQGRTRFILRTRNCQRGEEGRSCTSRRANPSRLHIPLPRGSGGSPGSTCTCSPPAHRAGGMGPSKSTAHVNGLTRRVRFKDPCVDNRNMPEDFRLGSEIINAFFEGRASVQCKKKRRALCMRRTSRGRGRDLSFASRGPGAAPGVSPADRHYLYFHEGKPDGQGNSKSGPKSHSKEVLWLCPCLATPHVHIQASGGRT